MTMASAPPSGPSVSVPAVGPRVLPAVRGILRALLPPAVRGFLCSQSERSPAARALLGALFGAASGAVLFLGVAHNLPLTFDLKVAAGLVFTAVCVCGAALSSSFRCSVLLVFPSMLGSRGRAYLMLLSLSVLSSGPVANIRRNAEAAALSLSCNLDLQVRHGRALWRGAVRPFILVTQELMENQAGFQSEAQSVGGNFQLLQDELVRRYGYDGFTPGGGGGGGNDTQEQFVSKTMMQCSGVVDAGVQRCADWFSSRWAECMEAIPVPVINHILCVPMRFHFLCDIMRVMTPWCRDNVPVEGNFGRLFDQLNESVQLLSREFSTQLEVKEEQQQEVLDGALLDQEVTQAVAASFRTLTSTGRQLMDVLQLLLSFTFITIFIQAFAYLRSYSTDDYHDNIYISAYFRRIDARRRRAGRRFLLPLRASDRRRFIAPCSPKIHQQELKEVMSGVFQVISVSLLSFVLLTVDFSLFHVLDIISRHTFTQFNLTSSHHVDIRVGGDSMMARLLKTTISAFNSSSSLDIHSDNRECVSPPSPLPAGVYVSCACCILLVALFSCIQVYTNRLRRVIAAFYHPEREKRRVLFLYNLLIQAQVEQQPAVSGGGRRSLTVCQRLTRWGRRLCLG